jgi:hypothetical protein
MCEHVAELAGGDRVADHREHGHDARTGVGLVDCAATPNSSTPKSLGPFLQACGTSLLEILVGTQGRSPADVPGGMDGELEIAQQLS